MNTRSPEPIDREALEEEIREEAFRIYERHVAAGSCRSPQDDWIDATASVLARHGLVGYEMRLSGEVQ